MAILQRLHSPPASHILESVKTCLSTWVDLIRTRLELLVNDLEEQRSRLSQIAVLAVASIFCLCLGIIMLTFLVITLFWDTDYRIYVVGGITFLYFLAGIGAFLVLRHKIKTKPRLFAATLEELSKDKKFLSSRS